MENGVDIKEQSRMLATLTSSKVFMVVLDILDLGRKYLYFGICFHIITNHSLEMNHHSKSDFKPISQIWKNGIVFHFVLRLTFTSLLSSDFFASSFTHFLYTFHPLRDQLTRGSCAVFCLISYILL